MVLRDRYVELSLDGWDATNGGVVVPARDRDAEGGGVKGLGEGEAATAAIVAKMELVEDGLPGGDAIDVTVSSDDRKVRGLVFRFGSEVEYQYLASCCCRLVVVIVFMLFDGSHDRSVVVASPQQSSSCSIRVTMTVLSFRFYRLTSNPLYSVSVLITW